MSEYIEADLKKLIGQLITMRENDLLIFKHRLERAGEEWDYEKIDKSFDYLQTALTRLLIGHSYCTNSDCICSAQSDLESVLSEYDTVFKEHLYKNQYSYLMELREEKVQ